MDLIFGKNYQTTIVHCAQVGKETEKAVCFRGVIESEQGVGHSKELSVWIPKSVLRKAKDEEYGMCIPFWFKPTFLWNEKRL